MTFGQVLGSSFGRGALYHLLQNRTYLGEVVHNGVSYPGEQERIIDDELWNAVQAKLEANRGTRRRSRIESGAILGGVIFDDRGNLMSPTYSIRRGDRYRYYISRALVKGRKDEAGSHGRIGADDIERAVVESLSRQLSRPELMNDVGSGIWSTETRTLVRDTVERVVVGRGEIQIVCKDAATAPSWGEPAEDSHSSRVHVVKIPVAQPRSRKEILIPGGPGGPPRRVSHDLVLAIARAKTWMLGLRSGKYADTRTLHESSSLMTLMSAVYCGSAILRPTSSKPSLMVVSHVP